MSIAWCARTLKCFYVGILPYMIIHDYRACIRTRLDLEATAYLQDSMKAMEAAEGLRAAIIGLQEAS